MAYNSTTIYWFWKPSSFFLVEVFLLLLFTLTSVSSSNLALSSIEILLKHFSASSMLWFGVTYKHAKSYKFESLTFLIQLVFSFCGLYNPLIFRPQHWCTLTCTDKPSTCKRRYWTYRGITWDPIIRMSKQSYSCLCNKMKLKKM